MAKSWEKNIQYEVFEPINFTKLNLSICDGTTINIYVKMDLSEETKGIYDELKSMGYDMLNVNDPFYQDICIPYTSINNTDMLLSDRLDYIYNNKDTQCQPNCQFSSYLLNSSYMNCVCDAIIDNNKEDDKKFNGKKLYESFYDVLKYSNFQILKCYKIVFKKTVFKKNFGCIIILISFILYFLCLLTFSIKGIDPLKSSTQIISSKMNKKIFKKNDIINGKIKENPVKKRINSIILNSEKNKKNIKKLFRP